MGTSLQNSKIEGNVFVMGLSIVQKAALLRKVSAREQHLNAMQEIIEKSRQEKRCLTAEENLKLESLEKQIQSLDDELSKHGTTAEQLEAEIESREKRFQETKKDGKQEKKDIEVRSINPSEVRSYRGKEQRMGNGKNNVTIGDLIYSYVTGKFRSVEVRAALSTTSGGLAIPQDVADNYIDMVREMSFLSEVTTYKMDSKTLTVPRVAGDVLPHFKAENDLIIESNPLFTGVVLEAKPLYALSSISLELLESSSLDVGLAVTNIMTNAMVSAMQAFMIQGGGALGYTGIMNDPNINKITAADVNYASIGAAFKAAMSNFGRPNGLIVNVDDVMNMELLTATDGQFIAPPNFMEYLTPYPVVNNVPAGTALVGDLGSIAMGILSEGGLQLEIDRSGEAFKRGQIAIRARINADFALTNPKLMSMITPTV
jgi:HK97 family phage major capsid protein